MKRTVSIAGLALALLAGCQPAHRATTSTATKRPTVARPSVPSSSHSSYAARGPWLASPTGLRLLINGDSGLELHELDTGKRRTLIPASDANGDYWDPQRVKDGFITQGYQSGNGDGSGVEFNAWFIPDGPTPRARLLGRATDVIDEPGGGVWLVDLPGYSKSGPITLVDTFGRTLHRGFVSCCHLIDASLGGGRFVAEPYGNLADPTTGGLVVYDAYARRIIRNLTPKNVNAEFLSVDHGSVVWKEADCRSRCVEHVVDADSGSSHTRPWVDGARSPDGRHIARAAFSGDNDVLTIDGRPIENAAADRGAEWSPDGRWLLFVRPDWSRFGIWSPGRAVTATTYRTYARGLELWTIFDQH